jgi:hypothetical protein
VDGVSPLTIPRSPHPFAFSLSAGHLFVDQLHGCIGLAFSSFSSSSLRPSVLQDEDDDSVPRHVRHLQFHIHHMHGAIIPSF